MHKGACVLDEPDLKLAGLSIWARAREFEQSDDYWDGNFLYIQARAEASGSYVETSGPWVRNDELASFADQLDIVMRDLRGSAELRCLEPMLAAKVEFGKRGDVTATVEITPDPVSQSHWFEFSIDQSYLTETLASCRRLLKRFPVRGEAGTAKGGTTWSPATESEVRGEIEAAEARMSADQLRFWKCVAIAPVKWAQHPYGDPGGGFWVVAIFGKSVIWYNDIEDGFDISSYAVFGEIAEPGSSQYELEMAVQIVMSGIGG